MRWLMQARANDCKGIGVGIAGELMPTRFADRYGEPEPISS